jgi:hypothetical protein
VRACKYPTTIGKEFISTGTQIQKLYSHWAMIEGEEKEERGGQQYTKFSEGEMGWVGKVFE